MEKCFYYLGEEEKRMFVEKLRLRKKLEKKLLDDLGIMWFQKSLYYAEGKTKEMGKKMKLNNRLKINTEREEINLDDFNENRNSRK